MLVHLKKCCMNNTDGVKRAAYTVVLSITGLFFAAVLTGGAAAGEPQGKEPPPAAVQGTKDARSVDNELAAKVNGVAITRAAVKSMAGRMAGGGDAAAISKEALDRLILGELAYQRAKESGMTLTPADLDNAINDIKENVGGEEMFQRALVEKKTSEEELRRELGKDLLIKRIMQKEVLAGIVINPEELNKEIGNAREEAIKRGDKADMRAIRRSTEKKLKAREEKTRMAAWEAGLRQNARIELMPSGGEKK